MSKIELDKQMLDTMKRQRLIREGSSTAIISKELFAQATELGMSRNEISKYSKKPDALQKLVDKKNADMIKAGNKSTDRSAHAGEKEARYTDAQYQKICKASAADWSADNDGQNMTLGDVANDLADSLLLDPKLLAYVKWKLGAEYTKSTARQSVADSIYG